LKFRSWIELVIGGAVGTAGIFLAKYFYKKIKKGKFDKFLTPEEKKNLIEAIEEFLEDIKGNGDETTIQKNEKSQ